MMTEEEWKALLEEARRKYPQEMAETYDLTPEEVVRIRKRLAERYKVFPVLVRAEGEKPVARTC